MKTKILLSVLFAFLFTTNSNAQLDLLKNKAANLASKKIAKNLSKQPITTNFKDCDTKSILQPNEVDTANSTNLCNVEPKEEGYLLEPGVYTLHVKSFCLKAGTYAPSKGDGYLYAPLLGPKQEIVEAIIKNWSNHPEVRQQDVQALLWAIIAKTKFNKMPTKMKGVATLLLADGDIKLLTKFGMDYVNINTLESLLGDFPKPVQKVIETENKIRGLLKDGQYTYQEMEKLVMLTGINPAKSEIDRGTWSLHPKGYYIAYEPVSYTNTVIKVYVPDTLKDVYFVPSDDVAVPASTGSQRLAMSDVLKCTQNK